jgi:small subunit ribosomal protein S5
MPKVKQFKSTKKPPIKEEHEFDQEIIDIARVTRVMAGGKRMRFRACVVVGDKKGRVGIAVAKGADVTMAINKAVTKAKKNIIKVNTVNETIPYEVRKKFKAAKILLKPAPKGTGIKAGGSVRQILGLAGVGNVTAKILGSNNKINNAFVTIEALKELKNVEVPEKKEKNDKKEDNNKK